MSTTPKCETDEEPFDTDEEPTPALPMVKDEPGIDIPLPKFEVDIPLPKVKEEEDGLEEDGEKPMLFPLTLPPEVTAPPLPPPKKKRGRKRKRATTVKGEKGSKKKRKRKKKDAQVKEEDQVKIEYGPVLDHTEPDDLPTTEEAKNQTGEDMALELEDLESIVAPKSLSIYNVVCTFRTGCDLDLKKIASRLRNTRYNPRRFPAVIIRHLGNDNFPKSTALIFKSGKVVLTGAKSTNLAHLAARKYTRLFNRLDFKTAKFCDFKIHNLVCGLSLNFKVRLEGLFMSAADKISYEPEIFPGLIYRMKNPKVTALVFVSGEVVLVGAKSIDTCRQAIKALYPKCVKHRAPVGFGSSPRDKKDKDKKKGKKAKKQPSKFPKIPKWLPT